MIVVVLVAIVFFVTRRVSSPGLDIGSEAAGPGSESQPLLEGEPTGQLKLNGRRWQISGPLAGERVQLVRIEQRALLMYRNTIVRELDFAVQGSTMVEPWTASHKVQRMSWDLTAEAVPFQNNGGDEFFRSL